MPPLILPIDSTNKEKARKLFIENWGTDFMVSRGKKHHFDDLDGFVAMDDNNINGMVTFRKAGHEIEIISLDSFMENKGIGTTLLNAVIDFGKQSAIRRMWLITTNDNLNALRFYQKRNWTITSIYKDAVTEARKIKPEIPVMGHDNIPIRHEIELEYEFINGALVDGLGSEYRH